MGNNSFDIQKYTFFVLGTISFLCGILFIWCYSKYRSFAKPSGIIALWISICCTCINFYYAYNGALRIFNSENWKEIIITNALTCKTHGFMLIFLRYFSWNLSLVLSIKIIQRVPENTHFTIYNLVCIVFSLSIALIVLFTDSIKESFDNTCYILDNQKSGNFILLFYAYTPIIAWAWLANTSKSYTASKCMLKLFWCINIPFVITHTWKIFDDNFSSELIISIESVFSSTTSLCVFLIPLYHFFKINQLEDPLLDFEADDYKNDIPQKSYNLTLALKSIIHILENSEDFTIKTLEHGHFISLRSYEVPLEQNDKSKIFSNSTTITAIEHAPDVYASICLKDSISKMEILNELKIMLKTENLLEKQASYSQNFLIKFISYEQLTFINNTLYLLHKHLITTSKNKSLINRIIGAYSFKDRNDEFFVVMLENIILNEMDCNLFELNGSKLVKEVYVLPNDENKFRTVKNDVDFMKAESFLNLSFADMSMLQKIVNDDLEFLKSIGAVEYSLFLAIVKSYHRTRVISRYMRHFFDDGEKTRYAISIIGTYNSVEAIAKKRKNQSISVEDYANRFLDLLASITQCQGL
ncbi:hypothetical protein SteCoe_31943 [Stentor coeruleus]|uniref:PIPK domain-containing protein n=1 Tax=Stentor coeruleus TaxID=5963 RepID=A0A1R2B0A9_9CILI|nr:hypothetical protein SteCoe_31943 [Stentor coeruleus]